MPQDLSYILVLFALFVVPRALQRYRLPAAITSYVIGAVAVLTGTLARDATLDLLATFGIAALFLTAGLEVNVHELRTGARVVLQHVAIQAATIVAAAWVIGYWLGIESRAAWLFALALFTPSAGFILDALRTLGFTGRERFWIRSKAIASELLALGVLFVALQSTSAQRLAFASFALVALALVLPLLFRVFAVRIAPFAPRSEFAFLLMLAVVSAYVTRALGVYYLVGAFIVGVAAQAFRQRLPAMSSERMLFAVEAFASVFAPFYFFNSGMHLGIGDLSPLAIGLGVALVLVCVPLRIGLVLLHRRLSLGEDATSGKPIAVALVPTLVFSLVIAEILRDRFALPDYLFGAIITYGVLNTLLPGFVIGPRGADLDVLGTLEMAAIATPTADEAL